MPLPTPAAAPSPTRRQFLGCAALALGAASATCRGQTPTPAPNPAESPEIARAVKAEQDRQLKRRAKLMVSTINPLVKRFGPDVLEELKTNTMESPRKRFEKMDLQKRDLSAVKDHLWNSLDLQDYQVEKLEDTPEKLAYRVTRCPHATAYRDAKGAEIGFALSCAWDFGFCKGINPAIQFTRTKTLMGGDCCCNHTYELKKA